MDNNQYTSPLTERYASKEMSFIFSPQNKHSWWRRLWTLLAETERELGLDISEEQIAELRDHIDDIDFNIVKEYEKTLRHDVMAHIHAYGDRCPKARPIIHLGATSCYVTDNTEIIQIRDALTVIKSKIVLIIRQLTSFAQEHKDLPCLGFTHYQPAQLTTVGKRACLWLQDILLDIKDLTYRQENLRLLGVKGATGTQASFLSLFNGNVDAVETIDISIAAKLRFPHVVRISGQTYTRKQDVHVLDVLSGIATTAQKFATDIRLLTNLKEVEEPFEDEQVGSSAMPYKRNPMRSERICALARLVMTLADNPKYTAGNQWLERTLDDSANRRVVIPEAFLAVDGILTLMANITADMRIYPAIIAKHINNELPFIATESILMACVKNGGDRQKVHEILRKHSMNVAIEIKEKGTANDLLDRLGADNDIPLTREALRQHLNPADHVGMAPHQVNAFINSEVSPILEQTRDIEPPSISITH